MKQFKVWKGVTQTHGFNVDVFRDDQTDEFLARIFTYSPPDWAQHFPGNESWMTNDEPEELRNKDLDQLRELIKRQITARCGKIKEFDNEKL